MIESSTSTYSHVSWQVYVYGTYAVVVIFLSIYLFFSIYTRRIALKNLHEEGFLAETKNKQ